MSKQGIKGGSKSIIGDVIKEEKEPQEKELQEKKSQEKKPQNEKSQKTTYVSNKNITLTEDIFGVFQNENGKSEKIYRYTWSNHNKIEVEVITYGARIRSIKIPNKKGVVDDIALGCKDLPGYIHYQCYPFGATLGRVTNYIENSTFVIDGKQYWLSSNLDKHHYNGGFKGFDQVIFTPYVDGTKVILSHTSSDLTEGYPGNLLVRITFELTTKNEFSINMEALTTKPTLVNLSNFLYFNLGGHQSGPEEIYKHTVTINSNCYTVFDENKLPTGQIQNVVHTEFDFQIPTVLKTCIGVKPEDGIDQNLCVNKGTEQDLCFVARALHTPSGRILEVYSNQPGVNFSTGNDFGPGLQKTCQNPKPKNENQNEENVFELLNEIHEIILKDPDISDEEDYEKMRNLVEKLSKCKFNTEKVASQTAIALDSDYGVLSYDIPDFNIQHMMTAFEINYLIAIKEIAKKTLENPSKMDLSTAVNEITTIVENFDNQTEENIKTGSFKNLNNIQMSLQNAFQDELQVIKKSQSLEKSKEIINGKSKENMKENIKENDLKKKTNSVQLKKIKSNTVPNIYKDGRIHGKNNAIYKRHGGICFQTQNYPNAIYHTNFPNSILRPGEIYKHTIVYKFFVQSGNPSKWIKRQCC